MLYAIINDLVVFCYYSSFAGDLRQDQSIFASLAEAVAFAEKAEYGYRIVSHHWELPVTHPASVAMM